MPICFKVNEIQLKKDEEAKKLAKQKTSIKNIPGRPVVLSQKRFNLLKQNADRDRGKKEMEEKRAERERMAKLEETLMAHIIRSPEQKMAKFKKQLEEKTERARQSLQASQEFYEGLRREKLANAELLVQKLKPGPRSLRSAAMQCELYRAREIQKDINEIIQDRIKKQEEVDKASCEQQAIFYVGEGQTQVNERLAAEKAYRAEMVAAIREHERMKAENKIQQLAEERREREQIDAEIRAQIEKERQVIDKQRQILRQNAIEAMKMAEERKRRETMYDEVEDRLGCVYNVGHRELEKLKAQQEKEFNVERQKQIDNNTAMLAKIQEQIKNKESERITRDINTMKLKFDAKEQEKRNREKKLKKERIEAHLKEMENARLAKERAEEVRRFEIAQRFKNAEVNARFYDADLRQQQQRAKCVRAQLMAQEEERQRIMKERKTKERVCDTKQAEQEDNFFFKYAHNLMKDANQKQRPLYPFKKVINEYKQSNMRDLEKSKLPRHMVSNVCITLDEDRDEEYAAARTTILPKETASVKSEEKKPISKVKAETLEHMAKIEAMFSEDECRRAAISAKSCIPYDCSPGPAQPEQDEKKENTEENCQPGPSGNANKSDSKLRYGIQELKNLCSGPAPSVH